MIVGRAPFEHVIRNRAKGEGLRVINDDRVSFDTQSSSQWDGFRHFGISSPHPSLLRLSGADSG